MPEGAPRGLSAQSRIRHGRVRISSAAREDRSGSGCACATEPPPTPGGNHPNAHRADHGRSTGESSESLWLYFHTGRLADRIRHPQETIDNWTARHNIVDDAGRAVAPVAVSIAQDAQGALVRQDAAAIYPASPSVTRRRWRRATTPIFRPYDTCTGQTIADGLRGCA